MAALFGNRTLATFLIFLGLSAAFIVLDQYHRLQGLEDVGGAMLAPLQASATNVARPAAELARTVRDVAHLRAENEQLRKAIADLTRENIALRELATENQALRQQLGFARANPNLHLLPATIIGTDTNPLLAYAQVDRGTADGVREGMAVLSPEGALVGRVSRAGDHRASVLLILSPSSSVNALVQTKDARPTGVVDGQYDGRLVMHDIPQGEALSVGDLVLTSGLGGGFPRGLLIGRVAAVKRSDAAMFQEAQVTPAANFARLEAVSLVLNDLPAAGP